MLSESFIIAILATFGGSTPNALLVVRKDVYLFILPHSHPFVSLFKGNQPCLVRVRAGNDSLLLPRCLPKHSSRCCGADTPHIAFSRCSYLTLSKPSAGFGIVLEDDVNADGIVIARFCLRISIQINIIDLPSPSYHRILIYIKLLSIYDGRRRRVAFSLEKAFIAIPFNRVRGMSGYLREIKGAPILKTVEVLPQQGYWAL